MSRARRFTLAAIAAASLLAAPAIAAAPAYATTLDASGVALDFSNPVDVSYLANAGIGQSHLYEGVATIGGVVVDAVVTLVGASDSSLGYETFEDFNATRVAELNGVLPGAEDALEVGCYSNEVYRLDIYAYAHAGFRLSDLLPGGKASFVDEYDGDPAENSTIKSHVDVCSDGDGDQNGEITVRVDFQVAGNPVTLTNVALNVLDLDAEQTMDLSSPKPSSWVIDAASLVTVSEATPGVLTFIGSVDPSPYEEPYFPERYTAEAHYDSVSSLTYTLKVVNSSGGGFQVAFDSYFPSSDTVATPAGTLAKTGVNVLPMGAMVLGALALGGALVVARRTRRNRV